MLRPTCTHVFGNTPACPSQPWGWHTCEQWWQESWEFGERGKRIKITWLWPMWTVQGKPTDLFWSWEPEEAPMIRWSEDKSQKENNREQQSLLFIYLLSSSIATLGIWSSSGYFADIYLYIKTFASKISLNAEQGCISAQPAFSSIAPLTHLRNMIQPAKLILNCAISKYLECDKLEKVTVS